MQDDELEATLAGPGILRAAELGTDLRRNNSGAAYNAQGRLVRYGLGNTSKRLWEEFKTPDYCGIGALGVFTGVEWKRPGWVYTGTPREKAQLNAINWIIARGGKAGFAQSLEDLERIILSWPML